MNKACNNIHSYRPYEPCPCPAQDRSAAAGSPRDAFVTSSGVVTKACRGEAWSDAVSDAAPAAPPAGAPPRNGRLHLAAAGKGTAERALVRIFEVTPHRQAAGEPRHADPAAQARGEVR